MTKRISDIEKRLASGREFLEKSRKFIAESKAFVKQLEQSIMNREDKLRLDKMQAELDAACEEHKKCGTNAARAIVSLEQILLIASSMRELRQRGSKP